MRASGLEGDSSSEIIEIFDDGADAFGDRAQSDTMHDAGGPRWVGPVAALALTGVIAWGVASSASSGGAPKVAPVTSTTDVARTTVPVAMTPVRVEPPVPYYAADPPPQFKVQFAEFLDNGSFVGNGYQLWATPGATATSGSWFSIITFRGHTDLYAQNAYRLQTDRGSFAIAHNVSGQSTALRSTDPFGGLMITAFGFNDEALLGLAESVTVGPDPPSFTDPSLIAGYEMISSVEPWRALQGLPLEQIYYAVAADPYGGFGVAVAPLPSTTDGGPALDRESALKFLLDQRIAFTVDGHSAVAGTMVDQAGYALASWNAGDHIVTVTGKLPVPQLIDIARTVHEVTSAEWDSMRFEVVRNRSEASADNSSVNEPPSVPVSFGTDGAGKAWTIQVSLATYGDTQQANWTWDNNSANTTPDGTVQINTVVNNGGTYVLADLPRAVAASAVLQVDRGGLDPVVVPFNDIDPTFDRTFAAYAFSETGPYTAQVIGPDGAVLATWPSP